MKLLIVVPLFTAMLYVPAIVQAQFDDVQGLTSSEVAQQDEDNADETSQEKEQVAPEVLRKLSLSQALRGELLMINQLMAQNISQDLQAVIMGRYGRVVSELHQYYLGASGITGDLQRSIIEEQFKNFNVHLYQGNEATVRIGFYEWCRKLKVPQEKREVLADELWAKLNTIRTYRKNLDQIIIGVIAAEKEATFGFTKANINVTRMGLELLRDRWDLKDNGGFEISPFGDVGIDDNGSITDGKGKVRFMRVVVDLDEGKAGFLEGATFNQDIPVSNVKADSKKILFRYRSAVSPIKHQDKQPVRGPTRNSQRSARPNSSRYQGELDDDSAEENLDKPQQRQRNQRQLVPNPDSDEEKTGKGLQAAMTRGLSSLSVELEPGGRWLIRPASGNVTVMNGAGTVVRILPVSHGGEAFLPRLPVGIYWLRDQSAQTAKVVVSQ